MHVYISPINNQHSYQMYIANGIYQIFEIKLFKIDIQELYINLNSLLKHFLHEYKVIYKVTKCGASHLS